MEEQPEDLSRFHNSCLGGTRVEDTPLSLSIWWNSSTWRNRSLILEKLEHAELLSPPKERLRSLSRYSFILFGHTEPLEIDKTWWIPTNLPLQPEMMIFWLFLLNLRSSQLHGFSKLHYISLRHIHKAFTALWPAGKWLGKGECFVQPTHQRSRQPFELRPRG